MSLRWTLAALAALQVASSAPPALIAAPDGREPVPEASAPLAAPAAALPADASASSDTAMPEAAGPAEAPSVTAAAATPAAARPLTPLMRDVLSLWESRRAEIAGLQARLPAVDAPTSLAIVREIERLSAETELETLQLQAAHARREGREADARAIEAAVAAQRRPAPPAPPAPRREPEGSRP